MGDRPLLSEKRTRVPVDVGNRLYQLAEALSRIPYVGEVGLALRARQVVIEMQEGNCSSAMV